MIERSVVSDFVLSVALTTVVYLISFALTFAILIPIQNFFLPSFESFASLMFLPHGVRIIIAWLYGWRSILLLAPGALLTHFYLFGLAGFAWESLTAAFFGIFCAAFSFWTLARLGMDFRPSLSKLTSWRDIFLAGCFASALNVFGTTLFYGHVFLVSSAYFLGDIGGMLAAMVILMFVFRASRKNMLWR